MNIMKKIVAGLLVFLAAHAEAQTTYLKFAPANGVLKGSTSTYVTTPAASSDISVLWTGTCDSTTYLRGDGQCQAPPGTGGGTVNSVALTAPSVFSVAGSPITTNGTLAITFATGQTANQVLATPNGVTGAVSLRSLVAADLPLVPLATGVTGILPAANGGSGEAGTITGLLKGNGTSAYTAAVSSDVYGLWSGTCNSTTYLRGDGACVAPGTVSSVALTVPSGFSVTGSPVTTTGTLAITGTLNVSAGGTGAPTLSGVLKGNGTSALTSAVAADVYALWSGSCSVSTFLRGDGACAAPAGVSGANPSATVGLTATNGTATTYLRSDGAPALDQSIAPTMTGTWNFTPSGSTTPVTINHNSGATIDFNITGSTTGNIIQFITNTNTAGQSELLLRDGNGDSFVTALCGTTCATPAFTGSPAGEAAAIGTIQGIPISFGTNNTERMRIEAAGNIDIYKILVNNQTGANNYVSGTSAAVSGGVAAFLNNRAVSTTADYGFADISTVTPPSGGTNGHATFDDRITVSGSNAFDHHQGFQSWPIYNNSNTITNFTSFWSQPEIDQGTITSLYGFKMASVVKNGGTVGTAYGLYIDDLTGVGSTNWGVFVNGSIPSQFGGNVTSLGALVGEGAPPTATGTNLTSIGVNSGLPEILFNNSSGGANSKVWDCYVDTTDYHCRVINDAHNAAADWLDVTRSGVAATNIALTATTVTTSGALRTSAGSNSQTTTTATNVFSVPTNSAATYLFSCGYGTTGNTAVSVISSASGTLGSATLLTNGTVTATISGTNAVCTQTSGSTQTVLWSVTRFGS